MQWYRIRVNKFPPTTDTLFATSLKVVRSQWTTCLESVLWQRNHGKKTGIVVQRSYGVFRCELWWKRPRVQRSVIFLQWNKCKSIRFGRAARFWLWWNSLKRWICEVAEAKTVRRTPMRNIVKEKPKPKGNECQADTPLKSFELFFDYAVITEFETWTNQKIENVKTSYTSKPGFL